LTSIFPVPILRALKRRDFLKAVAALPLVPLACAPAARPSAGGAPTPFRRVRPSDPGWPSESDWRALNAAVHDRLIRVESPLDACRADPDGAACAEVFKEFKNPYYIGDHPALTQTSGWTDAWTSAPSVYAVAAEGTTDVAAAVDFAREHDLRLVVKGGGHSYQGTSCAPDSLLVWTRAMHDVRLHDAFVPQGCAGRIDPAPAVSVGSGAIWMHVYDAVTTDGGRYVQGGGCGTVGVAGLVQSGGFGSFSKNFGLAAANLLEAEVVTADGVARIANACTNPELFWGLKGGGGGSLGVVTRLTLRTHDLPEFFGVVFGTIQARSEASYRRLIARVLGFYRDRLMNPHWGEQIRFHGDDTLELSMVFQGLTKAEAEAVWQPFFDWVAAAPDDYAWTSPPMVAALPARRFWDPAFLKQVAPQFILSDDRPGAPADNVYWAGNRGEAGQVLHAYHSAWLPAALLEAKRLDGLTDALFGASRRWSASLHFNKGLAGAPAEALTAARDTATNPDVLDAFALAIVAGEAPPAFPGVPGHEPDVAEGRRAAEEIGRAWNEIRKLAPDAGSYVSESDYFEPDWQGSFWGSNYSRLAEVKRQVDPDDLFFVHHGVGSEGWSEDGFTRLT